MEKSVCVELSSDNVDHENFTGESSEPEETIPEKTQHFIGAINHANAKTTLAFLEIGLICAKAARELERGQRAVLLKYIPFGEASFSKYVKIRRDKRLFADGIHECLPPHFSTLYEISQLTDEQLKFAVETKKITPRTTRPEILKFRRESSEDVSGEKERPYLHAVIGYRVEPGNIAHFDEKLKALGAEYGVEVYLTGELDLRADAEFYDRLHGNMIKIAKGIIHREVKRKLGNRPMTRKNLNRRKIFYEEEVQISDDASMDELEEKMAVNNLDYRREELENLAAQRTRGPKYIANPNVPVQVSSQAIEQQKEDYKNSKELVEYHDRRRFRVSQMKSRDSVPDRKRT
jgi:hypothetical protein